MGCTPGSHPRISPFEQKELSPLISAPCRVPTFLLPTGGIPQARPPH